MGRLFRTRSTDRPYTPTSEIYEIARKVSSFRSIVLLAHFAILVYLILKLWQQHQMKADRPGEPEAS